MDYKRIHDSIISLAKYRILTKDQYFEKHHIIPKCIGGTNDKSNIVKLLAKEHFLIHKLLVKIYPSSRGLKFAYWRMANSTNGSHSLKRTSLSYASARKEFSIAQKQLMKELRNSSDYKRKLSGAIKKGLSTPEAKANKSRIMKDRHSSPGYSKRLMAKAYAALNKEQRDKRISLVSKERFSNPENVIKHGKIMRAFWNAPDKREEQSVKIKLGQQKRKDKGIVNKVPDMVTCPYCNKNGLPGWMGRWHFENCREKS